MRALVLGGNGLIGGRIVTELIAQGIWVRSLDRTAIARTPVPQQCEHVVADFLDPGALLEAMQGIDMVFHCIRACSHYARHVLGQQCCVSLSVNRP